MSKNNVIQQTSTFHSQVNWQILQCGSFCGGLSQNTSKLHNGSHDRHSSKNWHDSFEAMLTQICLMSSWKARSASDCQKGRLTGLSQAVSASLFYINAGNWFFDYYLFLKTNKQNRCLCTETFSKMYLYVWDYIYPSIHFSFFYKKKQISGKCPNSVSFSHCSVRNKGM